jgi:hypothetical protein
MAFKIEWTLDESEALAQESLLGEITLSGDAQQKIQEESIYVDSWLHALVRGAEAAAASQGRAGTCDIEIEDPRPLKIRWDPDGSLYVRFRDHEVKARSLTEFTSGLRNAAETFLRKTEKLKDSERNEMLRSIRAYVERQDT